MTHNILPYHRIWSLNLENLLLFTVVSKTTIIKKVFYIKKISLTKTSISLSPKSKRSNFVSDESEDGSSLSKFSLNSKEVNAVSIPKSAGKDVKDMSLSPKTVKDLS